MPTFAGYEGVKEFHQSGAKSVWTARRQGTGSAAPAFAIKFLDPQSIDADAKESRRLTETFLERAAVQQKSAASGRCWARIHESGSADAGAAIVTDLYPNSVERQIKNKVKPDARSLHRIIGGIVRGLQEVNKACGRPHGNLRPSAVLIAGARTLAKSRVALHSPAAASDVEGKPEQFDFPALGEILYQLVTQRALPPPQLPLQPDERWSRLGRKGERWCALCSDLLDPSSSSAPRDLHELRRRVAKLTPAPIQRRTAVIITLMLLLIPVGWLSIRPFVFSDKKCWISLCDEYENWLFRVNREVAAGGLAVDSDPMQSIAEEMAKAGMFRKDAPNDPRNIARTDNGFEGSYRGFESTSTLRTDLWDEVKRSGRFDADRVDQLRLKLRRNVSGILLNPFTALRDALDPNRCPDARKMLSSKIDGFSFDPQQGDKSKNIYDRIMTVKGDWLAAGESSKLLGSVNQIATDLKSVPISDNQSDPVLSGYLDFALAAANRANSIDELKRHLEQARDSGKQLQAAIHDPHWDGRKIPVFAKAAPVGDEKAITDWINQMTQPIGKSALAKWWDETKPTLQGNRDDLALLKDEPDLGKTEKDLDRRLDQFDNEMRTELAIPRKMAESKIVEALKAVQSAKWDALQKDIGDLQGLYASGKDPHFQRDVLNRTYRKTRAESPEPRRVLAAILATFGEIDKLPLAPKFTSGSSADRAGQIAVQFDALRIKAIEDSLRNLNAKGLDPSMEAVRKQINFDGLKTQIDELDSQAESLNQQCRRIEESLDKLFKGDAGAEAASAELDTALQPAWWRQINPELQKAVVSVRKRAAAVREVEGMTRRDELAKIPPDDPKEVLWARWKQLGRLTGAQAWPRENSVEDLKLDAEFRQKLLDPNTARDVQLNQAFQARVERCIAALGSEKDPHVSLAQVQALNLDGIQLSDRANYNLQLGAFIERLDREDADDARAKDAVAKFAAALKDAKEVSAQVTALTESAKTIMEEVKNSHDPRVGDKVGPEQKPSEWTKTVGKDLFTFEKKGLPYKLVFRRVSPKENRGDASYVCTTEVSLRLFVDVASDATNPQVWTWKPTLDKCPGTGADNRTKPLVWGAVGNKIVRAPAWIPLSATAIGNGTRLADGNPPTPSSPMQHIPPALAEQFCTRLGCRLPTAQEWKWARDNSPNEINNLRDSTWLNFKEDTKNRANEEYGQLSSGYGDQAKVNAQPPAVLPPDGTVWFRDVPDTSETFRDLVGNVAEWVDTKPQGANPNDRDPRWKVIGDSACSPPHQDPGEVVTVQLKGYPDVGFRLAFSAKVQSLSENLLLKWRSGKYLTIPPRPARPPGQRTN